MFDTMKAPLVFAHGIGADGIVVYETVTDRKPERCRIYKDKGIPHEMRWQAIDTMADNQYSSEMSSVGPNGAVLPIGNSSDNYKALWNAQGNGIICYWDEVWLSWYWYTAGTATDAGIQYVELKFRPRMVTYSGLIKLWEFEQRCSRPCDVADNVIDYPCITTQLPTSTTTCGLPDTKTIADETEVKLPNGKDTTGAEIKLPHNKRSGYKEPCVKTCQVDPPPSELKFEPKKYLDNILNALNADINGFLIKGKISESTAERERTNLNAVYLTIKELLENSTIVISELYTICLGTGYLQNDGKLVEFWRNWKLGAEDPNVPEIHSPRNYYSGLMCIYFMNTLQSFQFISGKTFDFIGNDSGKYNHIAAAYTLSSLRDEDTQIDGDANNRSKNCAYYLSNFEMLSNVELIIPFQEEEAPPKSGIEKENIEVPVSEPTNERETADIGSNKDDAPMDER